MDASKLRQAIDTGADEAARWDALASTFRELGDDDVQAAREALAELAERLEPLVTEAEATIPLDAALVATAHLALRRAQHGEVWAGFVLHQRLPPTDLSTLA